MKTRFPKKLQGFLWVACITLMSGCGTFLSDRVGGVSGIEEDVRIVKEPFYWSLTLGLIPMAAIVSMPVDLAVDIVLYPFDVWLKNSLRVKDTPRPVGYSAPLYSINLTGGGDFDYAIWTYYDAPRNNTDFTRVTALQQPDSYTARAVSAPQPRRACKARGRGDQSGTTVFTLSLQFRDHLQLSQIGSGVSGGGG